MRWRWVTIAPPRLVRRLLYGMRFVEQQFFPSSDRPELVIDTLPQNSSIAETKAQMDRFEVSSSATLTSTVGLHMSARAPCALFSRLTYNRPTPIRPDGDRRERPGLVTGSGQLQQIARQEFVGTDVQSTRATLARQRATRSISGQRAHIQTVRKFAQAGDEHRRTSSARGRRLRLERTGPRREG